MSYTPTGIAAKVIEFLRAHPPGTWASTAVVAEAVGEATGAMAAFLKLAAERQWLRRRKEDGLCYWALGPLALGLPPEPVELKRHDTAPPQQTVIPAGEWSPEDCPVTVIRPEPLPPPPPDAVRCARAVRFTVACGRGLLMREGAVIYLNDEQTARVLRLLDALEPST